MNVFNRLAKCTGFQWDKGNQFKNWEKHGVTNEECEQVFVNIPLLVAADPEHSRREARFLACGKTDEHRTLAVIFTIRGDKIRIISARDADEHERRAYEDAQEDIEKA